MTTSTLRRPVALLAGVCVSAALALPEPAHAQVTTPRAGGEGTVNTQAEFEKLVAQCDNTDLLFERGKLRLVLGRTTDEAAKAAQDLLNQAFAQCGEGKIDEAKATMAEGFKLAQAGVEAKLEQDAAAAAAASAKAEEATRQAADADNAAGNASDADAKPWWQFW